MWRVWIGMVVGGVLIFVYGLNEARVGFGASSKAQEVNLADLEKGKAIDNNHIKVGKHVALFTETIAEFEVPKNGPKKVTGTTKVNFGYYPIISAEHPCIAKRSEIIRKYGAADKVPENEWPPIGDFAVLVKTTGFHTAGSIPQMDLPADQVQGLVINRIKKLEGEELKLLRESFPKMNFDKVLLLDSGRTPSSMLFALLAMLVGLVLAGSGGVIPWYLAKSKREEERRAFERQKARMAQAKANVRQAVAAGAIPTTRPVAPAQAAAAQNRPAIIQPGQQPPISQRPGAGRPVARPGVRPAGAPPAAGARPPMVRPGQLRRPPPKA